MKEFTAEQAWVETASALETVQNAGKSKRYAAYVGLDVHKDTIAVAIARPGRGEPEFRSEIANPGATASRRARRRI